MTRSLAAILFCVLTAASARADLIYENIGGAGLIYDTSTGTTWTQNADISGVTFTQQGAETWAAGLNLAGLPWELPTAAQFTSLYTDLFPVGPPGPQSNKFGASVSFGSGPNDQALNVQTTYWTSAIGTDFNFFYGYPGSEDPANTFSAWAVEGPEPSSLAMTLLAALATACFLHRPISKRLR
jgi:hypothetical protein